MKIFGRDSIGCGQCLPLIDTPVGDTCLYCSQPIELGDVGVVMPHVGETVTEHAWHLACLRLALGIKAAS